MNYSRQNQRCPLLGEDLPLVSIRVSMILKKKLWSRKEKERDNLSIIAMICDTDIARSTTTREVMEQERKRMRQS